MSTMKQIVFVAAILGGASIAPAQQQGLTLQVQLHYTGAGTVDASHKIFIALWDSADLSGGPPTEVKSTTAKNATVTFANIKKVPAFVSAAFDPTGRWDGASGPPPTGASLGMYSRAPPKPDPIDIKPGTITKVTITFNDAAKVP